LVVWVEGGLVVLLLWWGWGRGGLVVGLIASEDGLRVGELELLMWTTAEECCRERRPVAGTANFEVVVVVLVKYDTAGVGLGAAAGAVADAVLDAGMVADKDLGVDIAGGADAHAGSGSCEDRG